MRTASSSLTTAMAIVLVASMAVLPACRMNERLSGTIFGGGGGLVVGALIGGVGGALIGGGIGALAGYFIGDYIADTRERGRRGVFTDNTSGQVGGIKVVPEHVRLAEEAYEKGRSAKTAPEAKRWYEESLRLHANPAPHNLLALNALFAGDRALAQHHLETALELDPDYEPAKRNLERLLGR